jgi:hypothetical protein
MQELGLAVGVQFCLMLGVAGLLWPEKLKPVYEVLMFPWFPSYRTVRLHSFAAIGFSLVMLAMWYLRSHLA